MSAGSPIFRSLPTPPADPNLIGRGQVGPRPLILAPARGAVDGGSSLPGPQTTRSPLTDLFPVKETIIGGFTQITVPVGWSAGGLSAAWYPLIDIDPDQIWQRDATLIAVRVELASTNNADPRAVGAGEVDWGSAQGTGAAIVVGSGFQIQTGAFTPLACSLPDLNGNATLTSDHRYYHVEGFPPGSWSDAIPFKRISGQRFAPYLHRIRRGQRLQAALVIDAAQIQAGGVAGDDVIGYARVELDIGQVVTTQAFEER